MEELGVTPPSNLMKYLASKDKVKMGKYYKSHTKKAKRFRQKEKNRKQAAHVKKALDDAKKNAAYGPATGVEGQTNNVITYTNCKYSCYGCIVTQKSKKHKTNRSKWCLYYNKKGGELEGAIEARKNNNDNIAKTDTVNDLSLIHI